MLLNKEAESESFNWSASLITFSNKRKEASIKPKEKKNIKKD